MELKILDGSICFFSMPLAAARARSLDFALVQVTPCIHFFTTDVYYWHNESRIIRFS